MWVRRPSLPPTTAAPREEHTRSGRIPHVQLGHYVRYRQETVVSWVAEQEAGAFRRHRPQISARGEA
jgi:hypothetical protein